MVVPRIAGKWMSHPTGPDWGNHVLAKLIEVLPSTRLVCIVELRLKVVGARRMKKKMTRIGQMLRLLTKVQMPEIYCKRFPCARACSILNKLVEPRERARARADPMKKKCFSLSNKLMPPRVSLWSCILQMRPYWRIIHMWGVARRSSLTLRKPCDGYLLTPCPVACAFCGGF